ncbi:MAG TPA: LPS export ABC transporter periplasmic protein LptC [Candidatus Binatia bacterium]|jgi:LPS export ABC transporter protein LptC
MRKSRRRILLFVIFLALGGVAYKVGENIWLTKVREIKKNPLKALDYLPESSLHMRDFRRSKVENGRKVWEITGDEANYYKEEKQAVIKNPRFFYYDKKGNIAETTGRIAKIYLNDKELEQLQLEGNVQVNYQGYTLKSEEAIYFPDKQQIILPQKTTIVNDGMAMEGSRMEVELEEKKVRLLRDVKTKILPDKIGKTKKQAAANQMNEG